MKGIIRSYIIGTVYFFLHKQTEKDKWASCALQIFIGKVDKAELEIIYNFPEMGNRESLPSNSQFMIYW